MREFSIIRDTNDFEKSVTVCWKGLNEQELAQLRKSYESEGLRQIISFPYGLSWVTEISPELTNAYITISSEKDIEQEILERVVTYTQLS